MSSMKRSDWDIISNTSSLILQEALLENNLPEKSAFFLNGTMIVKESVNIEEKLKKSSQDLISKYKEIHNTPKMNCTQSI